MPNLLSVFKECFRIINLHIQNNLDAQREICLLAAIRAYSYCLIPFLHRYMMFHSVLESLYFNKFLIKQNLIFYFGYSHLAFIVTVIEKFFLYSDTNIIAEMSGNCNRSIERAMKIVGAAAETGVDVIKLQTYTAE